MAKIKKAAVAIDVVQAMLPKRDSHAGGVKGWRADVLKELKARLAGTKNLTDVTVGVYFSYALRSIEGRKRREYSRTAKTNAPGATAPGKVAAAKKSQKGNTKKSEAPKKDATVAAMDDFLRGKKVAAAKKSQNNDSVFSITSPDGKKVEYFKSRETAEATAASRGKGWTVAAE